MKKILIILSLFLVFAEARSLQMKPGESKIFRTGKPIATVFASEPKILDYKVINSNTLAVYSRGAGYSEVRVFDSKNELILSVRAHIDEEISNLERIEDLIKGQFPKASIKIEKLTAGKTLSSKKGYMITGKVPNEEARSQIYVTVATALGLNLKRDNTRKQSAVVTSQQGVQLGGSALGGGNENLDFLEKNKVDGLVDAMKVEAPGQVNVKITVADVEKEVVEKLGIDYNNGGNFIIPITTSRNQAFKSLLKTVDVRAFIEAIKDERVAKILATPNISVLSGESASFQVTSQYTPISNTLSNSGNAVASPQTPVDYGVSLTVQPRVFSKDRIVLNVSQEVSNIQSKIEVNGASAANLKKRRTQSVIELADGDSFILAGLIDERDIENVTSVPILGDIPIIGALFRKSSITRSKTELVVIATVTLTKAEKLEYIDVPSIDPRSIVGSLFNIPEFRGNSDEKRDFYNVLSNIGFIK